MAVAQNFSTFLLLSRLDPLFSNVPPAHRVLAKEQESIGGLKVLNYSPGPMMTDMSREIRSDEQFENDVREGKLIDPKLSAEKCVKLALGAKFANGAHVDFFDTEEN